MILIELGVHCSREALHVEKSNGTDLVRLISVFVPGRSGNVHRRTGQGIAAWNLKTADRPLCCLTIACQTAVFATLGGTVDNRVRGFADKFAE